MTTKLSSDVKTVFAMIFMGRSYRKIKKTEVDPSENATGSPAKRTPRSNRVTKTKLVMRRRPIPSRGP